MKIGYIGVGSMGGALARRLQLTQQISVFDINADNVAKMLAAGAQSCASAKELGATCDVVFTCLQTSKQVHDVIFGKDGLASSMKRGGMIIDQTTGDAIATREMAKELVPSGIDMIDAPVSGGPQWAEAGTIAIMAGGGDSQYARAEPLLRAISSNVFHCGDVGTGHVAKVCNNLLAASQRLLTFEVMALAAKNGLTPEKAVEVMTKGSGRNYTLDVTFRRHILTDELVQGFTLALMLKDVRLASDLAVGSQVPLFIGGMVREMYQTINNEVGDQEDVNLGVRYFERMAGVKIAKTPAKTSAKTSAKTPAKTAVRATAAVKRG